MQTARLLSPLPLAVPSWVVPGTAAENAAFLLDEVSRLPTTTLFRFTEMGLCCFETRSSLDCPITDYPTASSSLSFHVHLPTDLAWTSGDAPDLCLRLMERFAHLASTDGSTLLRAVLHPPASGLSDSFMAAFVERWTAAGRNPADLLLENHRDITAPAFLSLLNRHPVSVCLDVAHMLTYNQHPLLSALAPSRVRLLHWSAPGPVPGKDAHLPLTALTPAELDISRAAAHRFAAALPLIEVFSWEGIEASLPVLTDLYACS